MTGSGTTKTGWSRTKLIGERVNNYRIISLLGEGGMGAVYLAEHPFMGRKAAIKVLRREFAEDAALVERFMNEARAANAIRHPNIIDIIDVGLLESGIPYLMMEYLEGENLGKRLEGQRQLPIADALDVALQTASALHAAHEKGIVHRDLKPDNLYLMNDDTQPLARIKVLDFGIAKLRGELTSGGAKTQSGQIMGTPPYMSPEQCRGITDDIDHRTDIYSLGIIMYEMLAGAPPFMSAGWGEVVLMHLTKPPSPLQHKNPDVSPQLEAIIMKCLEKSPDDRWRSMLELEVALRGALPPGWARRPRGVLGVTMGVSSPMPHVGSGPRPLPKSTPAAVPLSTTSAPTTLRGASGQLADQSAFAAGDGDELSLARPSRRGPMLAIGGLALVAAVVIGAVKLRRPTGTEGAVSAGASSAASAPASPPAAPPIAPPPPAAAPEKPAAAPAPKPIAAPKPAAAPSEAPPAPTAPEAKSAANTAKEAKPAHATHESPAGHGKKAAHKTETRAETPKAPTSPGPAPRGKSGCDPNFYFDAQGEKHFKPECF
jgi:serine/threonine-protein kinase